MQFVQRGIQVTAGHQLSVAALLADLPLIQHDDQIGHSHRGGARAHLITERAGGEFAIHKLLRAYANDLAQVEDSEQKRESAVLRLLQSRTALVDHSARLLVPSLQPRSASASG
ncbi:MAG TPA: hypothetical protein VFQ44_10760 [Streptosporangiaceae bacterium]|nr:hypothetical protein [Streptosporangiaceae bacterium]